MWFPVLKIGLPENFNRVILDRDRVDRYLESIARGFERDPVETILSFLLLLAVLLLILFILHLYQRGIRDKKRQAAREVFESILGKKKLDETDRAMIRRMTESFPLDSVFLPKMLTDSKVFMKSASLLIGKRVLSYTDAVLLRLRLGMPGKGLPAHIRSSAEFFPGMSLSVKAGRKLKGCIAGITEDGVLINIKGVVPVGGKVICSFSTSSGYYRFHSYVTGKVDDLSRINHTEQIMRIQKRRFFRKRLGMPAALKTLSAGGRMYSTTILDLGGGGAMIRNPWMNQTGVDDFLLVMKLNDKPVTLKSRVVRKSSNKSYLGITFTEIQPAIQDMIIKKILK